MSAVPTSKSVYGPTLPKSSPSTPNFSLTPSTTFNLGGNALGSMGIANTTPAYNSGGVSYNTSGQPVSTAATSSPTSFLGGLLGSGNNGLTGAVANSTISYYPTSYSSGSGGSYGGNSFPATTTPVVQTPVSYKANAQNIGGASVASSIGASGTSTGITPSAPSTPNYGSTVAANNIALNLNPDGSQKVTNTTGENVTTKGADLGFGFNTDGTPKTATQAVQERIQYQQPDIAQAYNQAQQQGQLDQAMQVKNDISNQLNAETTRMNLDLQNLRGVGAKEGVTEAVYGQQSAEVTREAMTRILPLQAQLALAQDNVQLAQQHTDTLFKIYSQQAEDKANLYNKQVDAIYAELSKKDQQKLDEQKQNKQNQFTLFNNMLNSRQDAANKALANKDYATYNAITSGINKYNTDPNSPTFMSDNQRVDSQIQNSINNAISDGVGTSNVDVNTIQSTNPANVKNTQAITEIIRNNPKIGQGTKTSLSNLLGVIASAEDMASNSPNGEFTGLSPLRNITDLKIPFTDINILPFRNIGKRNDTIKNEEYINGINLRTQVWASGAALTIQQTKQVEQMTPKVTDTDNQIKTKLNELTNFMLGQAKSVLQSEGINFTPQKVNLFETSDLLSQASPEQQMELKAAGLIQ